MEKKILPKGTMISQKDYFRESLKGPVDGMDQAEKSAKYFLGIGMKEDALDSFTRARAKANEAISLTLANHLGRETAELLELQGREAAMAISVQRLRLELMGLDGATAIVAVKELPITIRKQQ